MKKIAVDAMGGDYAPQAIVEGVNQALSDFSDIEVQLYGDEAKIKQYLTATERVSIIHTDEKIDSDDEPTRAIRNKKNASMVLAAKAVKDGEADAVLSAGNTGALLAAGFFIVGRIKNIDRPGLMSTLPTVDGKGFDMLDLGANAENTAQHLHQYAVLGSFYAKNVRGIAQPRVGLLNNGTESSKGDPLRKETYELLAADESLNFIGNVEARDLMNGVADVVVADGFTGNAVLKSIEGTAAIVEGVNQALADFSDIEVQLYGDEAKIKQYLTATERVSIIHTDEKIDSDDEPTRAIRKKKNASMVLAAKAVKDGEADAVLSAGNTGALLAAGFFIVGRIKNIDRPGLMSTLPTIDGKGFDMLDLGANAENTAQHLHQYAVLGSFYAKNVRGIAQPRVGLLNNGTESSKGDPLRKETYELLAADESLNFIGNVEARDLMNGVADVVVADGFTGNAVLKSIEGTAMGIMGLLKTAITGGGLRAKLGALLLKDSLRGLKKQLNYSDVGGAVLFGVKAPVVKTHGSSDAKAVYSTIRQIRTMLETDVVAQTAREFSGE
ncbi:fatty acid/phospholipid synthesis protein [Streptococcus pneumoniae]|nr:fatty acid/phospholipid synthesis protein [Streptococcus pneumoniae]